MAIIVLFLSDILTKDLAERKLKGKGRHVQFPWLHFQYIENRGAAYGLLKNQRHLLLGLSIGTLFYISWLYYQHLQGVDSPMIYGWSLALILGGALGNIYDRVRYGYVRDFIYFKVKRAPIFNMADLYIISGVLMFLYSGLFLDVGL